jgi:hypothetical protein
MLGFTFGNDFGKIRDPRKFTITITLSKNASTGLRSLEISPSAAA